MQANPQDGPLMTAHPASHIAETAPPLLREDAGAVAVLTLNRPDKRNSLSEAMLAALTAQLAALKDDTTIRAIVLTAKGPVFCAGHDLKEMTARRADPDRGRAYFADIMARCATMMQMIVASPKPVIAAVQGTATAAGTQLVASCDLAVAARIAKFCTPGVHIGLFCSTPMVALSRNLSNKHAMEMLLLGDMVEAEDAYRFGLINRVVAPGEERDEAMSFANRIASKSSATVKFGKDAFYRQREMSLSEAYDHCAAVMVDNMLANDAQEGIAAFTEKRNPTWSHS
jgi:enoyl-CoA hydratase/carnithine racemase